MKAGLCHIQGVIVSRDALLTTAALLKVESTFSQSYMNDASLVKYQESKKFLLVT